MDSHIASVIQQGALDFLGEKSHSPRMRQRADVCIAGRGDTHQFDVESMLAKGSRNVLCLPQR
jgi:hypothetical protein